ncbi:BTAD domain-containing putative transcriptional regulator [Kutzneria viridogrisea]|uniref:DNA-binding SARP family transcriptional activator/tetratricopeptide (TPR) repeat protein/DNA-binding XRE family transcriptional regulator n=1 Tax=Kutzneria viridogrisea TaxID=47990 RepID=A0ABR6BN53_9PSEU|nr:DNA-binding SARP family transcriptional activator/tetratricopeptide (TPR) repeat protein/DNA-binding XRE family transcriptional regulator [Kutzneria viridogrisea]
MGALGELVRAGRLRAGLTQQELADRAGVSVRSVRAIERGQASRPQPDSLHRIAVVLGVRLPDQHRPSGDVEILVLGPLALRRHGVQLPLGPPAQRALLGLLALRPNEVLSRDEVVDVLWGHRPPTSWANLVHTYLARIRKLISETEPVILSRGTGYSLIAEERHLDLLRFEVLATKHTRLGEALDCWRGPVLADLPGGLRNHPAAISAGNRRLDLVLEHSEDLIGSGRGAEAVRYLEALLPEQPLHEGVHARLVTALAAAGKQAAAHLLYTTIRERLSENLGVEPGSELRRAHSRLVTGSGHLPPDELPPDAEHFTGRADPLHRLDIGSGLTVITGPGGVGKSALAAHWGHRARESFPDGTVYLDLHGDGPQSPLPAAAALTQLLRSLGVSGERVPGSPTRRAARFQSLVDGRRLLLVLDNASTSEQIRPLLPASPTCRVIVTSRERLPELTGADRIELDLLCEQESVLLLGRDRAELASRCPRLPLTLRLAAVTPLPGSRPLSTAAVLSRAYQNLTPLPARAFRLLGAHRGPSFDVHAIAALADTDLDSAHQLLSTLVSSRLVEPFGDNRFRMHDLVRRFAGDLSDGEAGAARQRLAAHYRQTAIAATAEFPWRVTTSGSPRFADKEAALAWLEAERANLVLTPQPDPAEWATVLWRYLAGSGHHEDARALYSQALSTARNTGDRLGEATVLGNLGLDHWRLGRYREALEVLQQTLAVYRELGEPAREARTRWGIGLLMTHLGQYREALAQSRIALQLARRTGNRPVAGLVLCAISSLCRALDRGADSLSAAREAVIAAQAAGDRIVEVYALRCLGLAQWQSGHRQAAGSALRQSLALAVRAGDRIAEGYVRWALGLVHWLAGRFTDARAHARRALDLAEQLGVQALAAHSLWALGLIETDPSLVARALDRARRTGDRDVEGHALWAAGKVSWRLGRTREATGRLGEALAFARSAGAVRLEGQVLEALAEIG